MPAREMRHGEKSTEVNATSGLVLEAAFEVHTRLGPGLLEKVYIACLDHELRKRGAEVAREVAAPVIYDGVRIDLGYRMDLVIARSVVVEVKAVEALHPVHFAQLLTYVKLSGAEVGLLLNFHEPSLKSGVHRVVV